MGEKKKKNIAFVSEFGDDIGYGHLYREIAIAESFLSKGCEVTFFCNEDTKELLYKKLPDVSVSKWNLLNKEYSKFDIIVFDVYKDSFPSFREILKKCEENNITTATVIDFTFRKKALNTDYIFQIGYQSYREKIQLKITNNRKYNWVYSGTDFLVFRKEFINIKSFKVAPIGKKILVTMGGSDPFKLTEFVSNSIEIYPNPLQITYIVGSGFEKERLSSLEKTQNKSKHSITVLQQVDNISEIMLEHDIAVINGGNTRFELASLGVPFISIAINNQQKVISDKIAEDGIGISLEEVNNLDSSDLSESLRLFLEDYDYRLEMSDKMKQRINVHSSYGKIAKVIDRSFEFRKLRDSELVNAYSIHCDVVEDMLEKGIRQWLRPIDFNKLKKRQKKNENFGLFLNGQIQVFLSLINRIDYHEWTKEMPKYSTIWLSSVSANVKKNIKGTGKVAIQLAIEYLKSNGTKELYLDCVVNNGFLVEYYKSLGFRELKQKKVKYRSGEFEVALMKKDLK